ncbi:hypothetical protein C2857_002474 [Epichloe festucae Fl1]|uniref:HECT-type E3 ubiquitin transferase n=1 Tax=Epichloe festucae (strain Fl1) TaxID=877507 RepID=A0A7U3SN06_EPIFF|nr:hypothetical protein C2857_002474 [Epichloe festucae Fl1]
MTAPAPIAADRGVVGANQSQPHDPEDDSHDSLQHTLDLVAGLWQEAPFARLPDDAPPELYEYVQDLENPRRVYAVHRASRRHDFQLLVDRYIYQLRVGCGCPYCVTPTCFTCRKRLVGKAPIRRYSPTSARTLAVFLASQNHPDRGLCPYLRRSNDPPSAANNLIFSAQLPRTQPLTEPSSPKSAGSSGIRKNSVSFENKSTHTSPTRRCQVSSVDSSGTSRDEEVHARRDAEPGTREHHRSRRCKTDAKAPPPQVKIAEKPACRDYRSFAATTFGTVAFKMLEWLTPQGLQAISDQYSDAGNSDRLATSDRDGKVEISGVVGDFGSTPKKPEPSRRRSSSKSSQPTPTPEPEQSAQQVQETLRPDEQLVTRDSTRRKRNSKSSVKSSTAPKPQRRSSLEAVTPSSTTDISRPSKANNFRGEKKPRAAKLSNGIISRAVPGIPLKPAFFENVPCLSPPLVDEVDPLSLGSENHPNQSTMPMPRNRKMKPSRDDPAKSISESCSPWVDYPLPQALSILNVELIEFICDTFQEDRSNEIGFFGPLTMTEKHPKPQSSAKRLVRKPKSENAATAIPRSQWKAFNEQTLFNVMSDPHALVRSFTKDGKLFDSQTLWYCMLRMTRAVPSLVFHSLWLAAKSLFVPPKSLKSGRLPSMKLFGRGPGLSNFEAGCVVSICLHALVAAAPCAPDSKTLYEMSRVRSGGSVLASQGGAARQPPAMCLEYDDVFSNDLALRLARRVFCAVTALECFADIANSDASIGEALGETDILSLLLNQLDLIGCGPARILTFSQTERLLHETRVPTLLLDWARAVLLQEWNGRPEYSNNGPFHGAMSLIATLYDNRNMLLLGDMQFRVDYFSDRLDAMEVPVSWIAFTSTRQMHHLLDHPYLFTPDTLVSFFRSINFSRMSRTFEESSSLKTRMAAIVDPGSLVTNTHHKHVLQDLLRTASSRYLVLSISRSHVLRDSLDQLWRRQERELLRPLKVHLGEGGGGEEGFDSGGVQQEFFRMAIAECLDPEYGAFTVDSRTRMAWFVPGSLVEEWKFEMIGLLMSLAVYNGLTLPITFPKALYRKLLGHPVEELYHIADGWPELASGLTALQEWDEENGSVEDIFARTYEFSISAFGGEVTLPMTKKGSFWPQGIPEPPAKRSLAAAADCDAPLVTNENRDEYISDYVRYLTDVSIRPQFRAFERGFRACLEAKSLSLLTPSILQSVVEGVQEIDTSELRRHTRYVGWDSSHRTVKDFWSIVKRYDDSMKRKLLEFVTASDRVPVGGMKNVQFVIQKNGEEEADGGHLPTAYTCYGTLLLPEYRDKEALRERLGMALENAQGFGFA